MRTPMLHRCFEEEVVSRRKNARPSRRQKHDTPQCMFLRSAKQGGSSLVFRVSSGKAEQLHRTKPRRAEGAEGCFSANFCSKPRDPRKGKQPERRQFAPFHETDGRRGIDPIAENRPREFRLPAEFGAAFGEGGFDPGHRALAAAAALRPGRRTSSKTRS